MPISVEFYGRLQSMFGENSISIDECRDIESLFNILARRQPAFANEMHQVAVAVDNTIVATTAAIPDNAVVALLPPVSGGSGDTPRSTNVTAELNHLSYKEIDVAAEITSSSCPAAGAMCCFTGTVREINDGRPVSGMAYSGHEMLAEQALAALEQSLLEEFPIISCRIVHRLGNMALEDVSVLIIVRAAHRAAAFDAARAAIDTLKRTLPVWKLEHYSDGDAQWLDGQVLTTNADALPKEDKTR